MTRILAALERRWARTTRRYQATHHRPNTHAAVTTRRTR
jgi:hypothetical protein